MESTLDLKRMGRLLAIDYGRKRTGLAATDPLQIIATPLETVATAQLFDWLKAYLARETVDTIVVGQPLSLDGTASNTAREYVAPFVKRLRKEYSNIPVVMFDERFTSQMAFQAMIDGGVKKKARQNKATIDKISAAIILQGYITFRDSGM